MCFYISQTQVRMKAQRNCANTFLIDESLSVLQVFESSPVHVYSLPDDTAMRCSNANRDEVPMLSRARLS